MTITAACPRLSLARRASILFSFACSLVFASCGGARGAKELRSSSRMQPRASGSGGQRRGMQQGAVGTRSVRGDHRPWNPNARKRAAARASLSVWRRISMGLVPEMFVDPQADEVLVRSLSFPKPCFPRLWYRSVPKICEHRLPWPRMLVRVQRFRLSDGRPVGGNDLVPARRVDADAEADEILLDFWSPGFLRLSLKRQEIFFHQGARVYRWSAPRGYRVEDARILPGARTVLIATSGTPRAGYLRGTLTVWTPGRNGQTERKRLRVRKKSYPTPRSHFVLQAMAGPAQEHPEWNLKPRPVVAIPLRRPRRMRLAVARWAPRVALYAFGDLFVYRVRQGKLETVRRTPSIFYVSKRVYVKGGTVQMSAKGRYVSFIGRGEIARVLEVATGRIRDVPLDFRAVDGWWSHALPPSRWPFARAQFESLVPPRLWLTTFALLASYRRDLSLDRTYQLSKGVLVNDLKGNTKALADTWSILKFAVTRRRVVLLAWGRLIVLDRPSMSLRGWIGAPASVDLNNNGMSALLWFLPQFER